MKALRDAIDDLRTEYVHAIRNADCPYLAEVKAVRRILPSFPLDDALEMDLTPDQIRQAITENVTTAVGLRRIEKNSRADAVPETIACCPAMRAPRVARSERSKRAGPTSDVDEGPGWNYLGVCPDCQARRAKRRPEQSAISGIRLTTASRDTVPTGISFAPFQRHRNGQVRYAVSRYWHGASITALSQHRRFTWSPQQEGSGWQHGTRDFSRCCPPSAANSRSHFAALTPKPVPKPYRKASAMPCCLPSAPRAGRS